MIYDDGLETNQQDLTNLEDSEDRPGVDRYTSLVRVARRFVIKGRVQGVGFRYFAQEAALREGLHGWVTNREDGVVEALAEGERDAVERFEWKLRRGPSSARVDEVFVDEDVPAGRTNGFVIK